MRMMSRIGLSAIAVWITIGGPVQGDRAQASRQQPAAPKSPEQQAESLVILPAAFTLSGRAARQRLLLERVHQKKFSGERIAGVTWTSSNPRVVRMEKGIAVPVGDGRAVVTAHYGTAGASASVTVSGQDHRQQWSFRNHVQSVLSKAGCNSGACHGAAAGKNGFKLSLRGYDPGADFQTITRQSHGRRIVPSDPGRSLLLLKPTGAIPHKGGLRFRVGSLEYRVVSEWIAAGAPAPRPEDARLSRLEILPRGVVLKRGSRQQMIVLAHFTDGHTEDVTRWAKYSSTNLTVAKIDRDGLVNITGNGEGAIVAWYLSKNVIASITAPYETDVPAAVFRRAARSNFIDDLVLSKLQSLNIPPSPPAGNAEFLRRAFLDTIGVLPTAEETRSFLADRSPDKRDRLVDRLLTRPEFVDYWSYRWSDLLLVSGKRLRPQAVQAYYKWIRRQVAADTPWDQFARDVVTARGSTFRNGAANFYTLHQDPLDMAETVSMAFLGMSIGCARCHDHPLEKWTNDQYYGMVSLFARVRGKGWGGDYRSGDGNRTVFSTTAGELIQPRTGRPQPPRPLDGKPISFDSPIDRRIPLADWLTNPSNPYFSRAIVNRVWANFLGVGLVEKVDDLRRTNPPSNTALLDALAAYLVKSRFDLKRLMRLILTSKTYQRSSRPLPGNRADTRFYSRFYPRRLRAEVLLDAVAQVSGAPTKFKGWKTGTRAMQLPDSNVASYFLKAFGRPERVLTCECERSNEPSMVQVLHLVNGNTLNQKLAAANNRLDKLLAEKTSDARIIEDLYLAALSREPTPLEKRQLLDVLAKTPPAQRRVAVEDLFWSVLSSKEFLFNH